MHLYEAMRDVFHPSDGEWLADRFRVAAKTRWQRLACSCDDGHGSMQVGSTCCTILPVAMCFRHAKIST